VTRAVAALLSALALAGCAGDTPGGPPDTSAWTPTSVSRSWPDEAGEPIPVPAQLSELDWLADVSHYGQDGLYEGRDTSGSFGVGNGIVFGLIGLDSPWNTLTNAIGPGYQRDAGFFGDTSIRLMEDGEELEVEAEQVQRPRRSAVVRTLARSGDVTWSTTDVAPPGRAVIARHVTVGNGGAEEVSSLSLRLTLARADEEGSLADGDGLRQVRGERQMRIECPGAGVDAGEDTLDVTVPPLAAGDEWSVLCLHAYSDDGAFEEVEATMAELLQESRADTAAFLDRATALDLPDPKVEDLIEGILITEYVQTSALGVVSPMHRYTSGWLRDSEGPVRLYLRAGLHEEVRTLLDAVYQVMVVRQSISNSFDLDTDLSDFSEPADPAAFWEEASFMPGRGAAEAPSYAVLLHDLYVRHSGDDAILGGGRTAFLEACLRRQELSGDDLLPFSGDETFRFSLATAIGGSMPEEVAWSANSSFLFAAAADRLVELGGGADIGELGQRVREAAEDTYFVEDGGYYSPVCFFADGSVHAAPYEDVSTQPLWTGYATADDPRQLQNVDAIVERLMREDGSLLSTLPDSGEDNWGYTGMVPGFSLRALAIARHPDEERAFDAVDLIATPSGHFEEGHRSDHAVFHLSHQADGLGTDAVSRYRPWEGGDVAAAVMAYLVGAEVDARAGELSLAPHLPNGWPTLAATDLRMGVERYSLQVEGYEEGIVVRVVRHAEGGDPWSVTVEVPGAREITQAWIDGTSAEPAGSPVFSDLPLDGGELQIVAVYGS